MDLTVGSIYEGKVTGITPYGAFVQLAPGKSGMVHISEISDTYVEDINKHLKSGDVVKVKLLAIDEKGRIKLSIKRALPREQDTRVSNRPHRAPEPRTVPTAGAAPAAEQSGDAVFEDKLRLFMQRSEAKISDLKHHSDRRGGARRRK